MEKRPPARWPRRCRPCHRQCFSRDAAHLDCSPVLGLNLSDTHNERIDFTMSSMKIFLSAVSSEFEACRDELASDLRKVGAEVIVQRELQQQGRTLLEKLESYIVSCDRVIALVGNAYGWEPDAAALPAGTPRRSYTQWEYFFAQGERLEAFRQPAKDTFVYVASPEFPRPNAVGESPEVAALQQEFIAGIRARDKDHRSFRSVDELRRLVVLDGFHLVG